MTTTQAAKEAHARGEPVEVRRYGLEGWDWVFCEHPSFEDSSHNSHRPEPPDRTSARLERENPVAKDRVVEVYENGQWIERRVDQYGNGLNHGTSQSATIPNPNPNAEVKEQLLSAVYDSRDRHRAEMETEARDAQKENRASILDDAKRIVCEERNKTFGEPEDLFTEIAGHWSLHLGHPVTAKDVATMMLLFKATRCKRAPDDRDSWVDAAGYAACGGGIKL